LIDLISSGRVFYKVLLYFIGLWPTELANKSTCKIYKQKQYKSFSGYQNLTYFVSYNDFIINLIDMMLPAKIGININITLPVEEQYYKSG